MKREFHSIKELQVWSADFAKSLRHGDLLLLEGPMGSGKTKLVSLIVTALEGKWPSSPTYTIHQTYICNRLSIDHFDLFRLKNDEDLSSTGFWDILGELHSVIIIEWADRLNAAHLPLGWRVQNIKFEITGEDSRLLTHNRISQDI